MMRPPRVEAAAPPALPRVALARGGVPCKSWSSRSGLGMTTRSSTHKKGYKVFAERLELLRIWSQERSVSSGEKSPLTLDFDIDEAFDYCLEHGYKHRADVEGCLLHYAIELDSRCKERSGARNTELVLQWGARLDGEASYKAEAKKAQFFPIHLAAGLGAIDALDVLIKYRADVDKKTVREHREHYTALHEACFTEQASSARRLLEHRADVNMLNLMGQAPIHIVARNGNVEIAQLLVDSGARLDLCARGWEQRITDADASLACALAHSGSVYGRITQRLTSLGSIVLPRNELQAPPNSKSSPLEVAVSGYRKFPMEHLHIFAPFLDPKTDPDADFLEGIAKTCRVNMSAARTLIQNFAALSAQDPERLEALQKQLRRSHEAIEGITDMLYFAPEVAADILELLFVTPKATHNDYHPLPVTANYPDKGGFFDKSHSKSLHTVYEEEKEWKFDPQKAFEHRKPDWHRSLAPPPKGTLGDLEVEVKVLLFPNIVDTRFLHALNHLRGGDDGIYERLFSRTVVHAIVDRAWKYIRKAVYFNIFLDCLVVGIMTMWALAQTNYNRIVSVTDRALWSALSGCTLREIIDHASEVYHHFAHGLPPRDLVSRPRLIRIGMVAPLAVFCAYGAFGSEGDPERLAVLLSFSLMLRWMKVLHMLRLLAGLGEKLLAFSYAVFPMADFFVFAGMVYMAFLTAFASIRGDVLLGDLVRVLFFGAFTGDDNAFHTMAEMDSHASMGFFCVVMTVLVFTLAILNLMISISGNMYGTYEQKSGILFLQERAMVVEDYFMRRLAFCLPTRWTLWCTSRAAASGDKPSGDNFSACALACQVLRVLLLVALLLAWAALVTRPPSRSTVPLAAVCFGLVTVAIQSRFTDVRFFDLDRRRGRGDGLCDHRLLGARCPSGWLPLARSADEGSDGDIEEGNVDGDDSDSDDKKGGESVEKFDGEALYLWVCERKPQDFAPAVSTAELSLAAQLRAMQSTLEAVKSQVAELAASADGASRPGAAIGGCATGRSRSRAGIGS